MGVAYIQIAKIQYVVVQKRTACQPRFAEYNVSLRFRQI
jgi:hypothetical protein